MGEGQDLKSTLRSVFDSQIPNYGDYNLVFGASPRGILPVGGPVRGESYVLGYRWSPAELMIAPVDLVTLSSASVPVEVNMTNLSHAHRLGGAHYEVGTNTGRVFQFGVEAAPVLHLRGGQETTLDQVEDHLDFEAFMKAFVAMA